MYEKQVITGFADVKISNVTAKNHEEVDAARKEAIKNGTGTLSLEERVHLHCSPLDPKGVEYPGYSDVVNNDPAFKKEDGTSPIIEWQWHRLDTGAELSNSGNDPFKLGSYEPDGCTPTLTLKEQLGAGRVQVSARPFVRAQYNGGHEIVGRVVTFWAD